MPNHINWTQFSAKYNKRQIKLNKNNDIFGFWDTMWRRMMLILCSALADGICLVPSRSHRSISACLHIPRSYATSNNSHTDIYDENETFVVWTLEWIIYVVNSGGHIRTKKHKIWEIFAFMTFFSTWIYCTILFFHLWMMFEFGHSILPSSLFHWCTVQPVSFTQSFDVFFCLLLIYPSPGWWWWCVFICNKFK